MRSVKRKSFVKKIWKNTILVPAMALAIMTGVMGGNAIRAYYTHKDSKINKFEVGNISITITEDGYTDNQVIKPNGTIVKDPKLNNVGSVSCYMRAQVYVPVMNIKYVDENEHIVDPPEEGMELFKYDLGDGWQEVEDTKLDESATDEEKAKYRFNGYYEDEDGNKYKVHTYKYTKDGEEQPILPNSSIDTPVFSSVKAINYLDSDVEIPTKLHVCALGIQSEGGDAETMWARYIEQNNGGIMGV